MNLSITLGPCCGDFLTVFLIKFEGEPIVNKDSWIALIIASIITMIVAAPLYYSSGSKAKISEGSDTKSDRADDENRSNFWKHY